MLDINPRSRILAAWNADPDRSSRAHARNARKAISHHENDLAKKLSKTAGFPTFMLAPQTVNSFAAGKKPWLLSCLAGRMPGAHSIGSAFGVDQAVPTPTAIPRISMNNKIIALVSIGVVAVTFMSCKCAWAGSARELTVTPTANDTNAPITVRTTSGALGSIKRLDSALDALLAKGCRHREARQGI
jgi:hypothetical protein